MRSSPVWQLAIFDFDGTIADSFPCLLQGLNAAAARFGFRAIPETEVERLRGYSPWQVMEHIEVATWQVPMITQFVQRQMTAEIESVSLFPGIHESLEDLAASGVGIAIVSSNSEPVIRHVLGPRLASLVRDCRCDVSIFGKRPKMRQALMAAGRGPGQAIAIGDEIRDLRAARAEGIAFAGVTWGFASVPALLSAAPDLMFARVEDIAPTLCGGATPLAPRG